MEILRIDESWDATLTAFLDQAGQHSPAALAYHYPFYREALREEGMGAPYNLLMLENGIVYAYLPGFLKQTPLGAVYNSMPYFGANGGVIAFVPPDRDDPTEAVLEGLEAHLSCEPDLLTSVIHTPVTGPHATYRAAWPDAVVMDRFTQLLDLDGLEWPAKVRYDLRRSEKLGVTVDETLSPERLSEFYRIYAANCEDAGIAVKSFSMIERLCTRGRDEGHVHIAFALHNERLIGGLMTLMGGATASYYIPCSLPEARSLQPGMVLADHAIQVARNRAMKWWNWEASPGRDSGVYAFKHRWGSREAEYLTLARARQPEQRLREIGADALRAAFPCMFVYPFSRLES